MVSEIFENSYNQIRFLSYLERNGERIKVVKSRMISFLNTLLIMTP